MLKEKEMSNLLLFGRYNEVEPSLMSVPPVLCKWIVLWKSSLNRLGQRSEDPGWGPQMAKFQGMENWQGNSSFPSFFIRIFCTILESNLLLDLMLWNIFPVGSSVVWSAACLASTWAESPLKKQCDIWIWNFWCPWRQTSLEHSTPPGAIREAESIRSRSGSMGTTAFPQNGDGRRKQSVWVRGGDRLIPLSVKVKDSFGSFPSPSPKGER